MVRSKFGCFCGIMVCACVVWAEVGIETLPELHAGTVGIKTEFSSEIWGKNPSAEEVITQIKNLANAPLNEEERHWLRQILLTEAGGVASLEKEQESFLKARLDTLMAQGLFDDVVQLIDQIEATKQTPLTKQYKMTALFAKGNSEEVCQEEALAIFGEEEPFVRVACAWDLNTPDEVALAYDVYQENATKSHPFLKSAGDSLYLGKNNPLPKGVPSVWEMPILAANRPGEVMALPLNRGLLMVIDSHRSVPVGVRDQAKVKLYAKSKQKTDIDDVLKRLKAKAEARQAWEEGHP